MTTTKSTTNSTSCITYLPQDTEISTRTQLHTSYYESKIPYINTLFTKEDLPTINLKGQNNEALISEVFAKNIGNPFKQKNDEFIYSFKTDFTRYFNRYYFSF